MRQLVYNRNLLSGLWALFVIRSVFEYEHTSVWPTEPLASAVPVPCQRFAARILFQAVYCFAQALCHLHFRCTVTRTVAAALHSHFPTIQFSLHWAIGSLPSILLYFSLRISLFCPLLPLLVSTLSLLSLCCLFKHLVSVPFHQSCFLSLILPIFAFISLFLGIFASFISLFGLISPPVLPGTRYVFHCIGNLDYNSFCLACCLFGLILGLKYPFFALLCPFLCPLLLSTPSPISSNIW